LAKSRNRCVIEIKNLKHPVNRERDSGGSE
jgi:hypothetical protein